MYPSTSLATLRPDLGDSLEEFDLAADREGFIGLRVFPVIESEKKSGSFGKRTLESLLQNVETARSPDGGYNEVGWNFTEETFNCVEHGLVGGVDENEAEIFADYFDAELETTEFVRDLVLRSFERRIAAMCFNATTFGSQKTEITNEWDPATHKSDATPILDVNTARQIIWARCGLWPNTLVINKTVFHNLRLLDDITAAIASSGAGESIKSGQITLSQLAQCFALDQVVVAGSPQNTADEGQDAAIAHIWSSEYALLCRTASTKRIKEPCIGRVIHWGADGSQLGGATESYRDESRRQDKIRVRMQTDEKMLISECAQLLYNITP